VWSSTALDNYLPDLCTIMNFPKSKIKVKVSRMRLKVMHAVKGSSCWNTLFSFVLLFLSFCIALDAKPSVMYGRGNWNSVACRGKEQVRSRMDTEMLEPCTGKFT